MNTKNRNRFLARLLPAWVWVRRGLDRLRIWEYTEQGVDQSRFGDKEFQCPECGKVMHIGVKEDHLESHEPEKEEDITETTSVPSSNKVKLSDYVDDYEIDWEEKEKEESGIEIQEATGGQKLKKKQLRKKWQPFLKELRCSGKVEVSRHQHHGGLRGAHIVQRLKKDLKRVDHNMDLEYDIGEAKSTVQRRN